MSYFLGSFGKSVLLLSMWICPTSYFFMLKNLWSPCLGLTKWGRGAIEFATVCPSVRSHQSTSYSLYHAPGIAPFAKNTLYYQGGGHWSYAYTGLFFSFDKIEKDLSGSIIHGIYFAWLRKENYGGAVKVELNSFRRGAGNQWSVHAIVCMTCTGY